MLDLASRALDRALRNGVTYADVRVIETRERHLSTKSGKAGRVAMNESLGLGIRLISQGCWGFAATDDLTPRASRRLLISPLPSRIRARWPSPAM